jgi:hypothetical protein
MKTYYNYLELLREIKQFEKNNYAFSCDIDLYVLYEYTGYNNEKCFQCFKNKLYFVKQINNNLQIITSYSDNIDVILTTFGFITKICKKNSEYYYCFDINSLIRILSIYQKKEINESLNKISKKYNDIFEDLTKDIDAEIKN